MKYTWEKRKASGSKDSLLTEFPTGSKRQVPALFLVWPKPPIQ